LRSLFNENCHLQPRTNHPKFDTDGPMKEIQQEYLLKTSPPVLFTRISSAPGLAEWFADNVEVEGAVYKFIWGDTQQEAEIVKVIPNESIRFRWLDSNFSGEFEFCIVKDDLTGDIALIISDNIDDDEEQDAKILWDSQVSKLKQVIGSLS
jgi:uncharacterized protein YndB with AHSA1/START domain